MQDRGTAVSLTVGEYSDEFYVEVLREIDRATTCRSFKQIAAEVQRHAKKWA